jgi:hypothetical protein
MVIRFVILLGVLGVAVMPAGAQSSRRDEAPRQEAFAAAHHRDWRKCKKCVPALALAMAYLKDQLKRQDQWYDGALGAFYAGFAFLVEGNSPKELDTCLKKARYFIKTPPGYNPWIVGMSTLLLCEASLKYGLTPENREAIAQGIRFFQSSQEPTGGWHHGNKDYYTKDIAMVSSIVYAAILEARALGIETGPFVDRARAYFEAICGKSFGYSSGGKDGDTAGGRGSYTLLALLGTGQLEDPFVKKLSEAVKERCTSCAQGHANGALHYFGVGAACHRLGPEAYFKYVSCYLDRVLAVAAADGSVGSFPCDCPPEKEAEAYEAMRTKDNPGYETRFCATAVLACMILWQQDGLFRPKPPRAAGKPAEAVATKPAGAPPPETKPARQPVEGAVAAWKEKLRARLAAQMESGKGPSCRLMGMNGTVARVLPNGDLAVRFADGGEAAVAWGQVGPMEGLSLARGLLREGTAGDHALLAFYLILNRQEDQAAPHLARSGDHAKSVETSFKSLP